MTPEPALDPATPAALTVGLTDTHAHLSYIAQRQGPGMMERIANAYRSGGALVLDPGVEFDDLPARKALLGHFPFVRFAAGIWPDAVSMRDREHRVAILEEHVQDSSCIAVGECGLDYHWMNGTKDEQAELFRSQAQLALRYGKPLIVHSREAHEDTAGIVASVASNIPVVIHCFGYGSAAALEYARLGCYVSFAGNMTYRRSVELREACAVVPDDRILIETDSPYMNPEPMRGKDCSPLDIARTYAVAAALRRTDVESLSATVARNARSAFGPAWASAS